MMSPLSASYSYSAAAVGGGSLYPQRKAATFFLLFTLLVAPTLARNRHIISIGAGAGIHPGCLAWDPTAQHFLVGSRARPSVFSVSDAGVVETLVSDPLLPNTSVIVSVAVDDARRRLLVALSAPAALASYDLRSPRPHRRILSSDLPAVPGGAAVDPASGDAYVTSAASGVIWRVDPEGRASVLSESRNFAGGLGAVAHVPRGFLLATQGTTGKVFKVDDEDGHTREVLSGRPMAVAAVAVAVKSDGSAVVAVGSTVRAVKSADGWGEAAVYDESVFGEGKVTGVTVREGRRAYMLVAAVEEKEGGNLVNKDGDEGYDGKSGSGGRIEEVEWEKGEGDMVMGMVLLGLGLTIFLYWRFQMGQLVTSINKKRE